MNVALCAPYGLARVSGISAFLQDLEKGLRTQGHSVEVLTPDRAPWIDRLPTGLRGPALSAWTLVRLLWHPLSWRTVHANQPHLQSVAALVAARVAGVRFIVTYHSPMPPAAWRASGWGQSLSHRVLLRGSDAIAFVSEATRIAYPRARGPVVRIGCDIRKADEARSRVEQRTESPFRFLFAGRQTQSKGFFDFLEASARLANQAVRESFRVVLSGETPTDEIAEKNQRVERIRDIVEDHGILPNGRDVLGLMARTHALVLPSYREGLPLAVLEAMAVGCVPIVSRIGGIPEVVRDRVTGLLVIPGDIEGLMADMRWSLHHPKAIAAMGQAAAAEVRSHFSFDTTLAQYLELYAGCRPSPHESPDSHERTE